MLANLIPVFAVFVVLLLIIAIALQRRRDRLAREREAEREAKRERDQREDRAEHQNKRDQKRSGQRQLPPAVHVDQEQGLAVEDLRRLFIFVLLAAQFVAYISQSQPHPAVTWLRTLGGKLGLPTDRDGLSVLLHGLRAVWQIRRDVALSRPPAFSSGNWHLCIIIRLSSLDIVWPDGVTSHVDTLTPDWNILTFLCAICPCSMNGDTSGGTGENLRG